MTYLPNILTSARVLLVPLFLWLVTRNTLAGAVLGLLVFIIASVTDSLDGYYARKHGTQTDLGRFLDPLADKLLVLGDLSQGIAIAKASAIIENLSQTLSFFESKDETQSEESNEE